MNSFLRARLWRGRKNRRRNIRRRNNQKKKLSEQKSQGPVDLWFSNTDISIEVLSRLPAKTLQGFKLVSKEWYHLISDRSFISQQLKRKQPVSGFFFQERYIWCDEDIKSISFIPIETESKEPKLWVFDFLPESVVLLATTNGLVCCRSCFPTPDPMIYVCNPLIKKWVAIKSPAPDRNINLGLAFDPVKDPIDERTSFKVVVVHHNVLEENENEKWFFSFDVYSEETGVWTRLEEKCQCRHRLYKSKGVFIGGALYWPTDGDQILMFDVENNLSWLIKVPMPFTQFESLPEMCIGESQGRLHYILVSEIGVQVWVLEDFLDFTWSVKHWVGLDEMEKKNRHLLCNLQERVASRYVVNDTPWMDPLAYKDGVLLVRVASRIYFYHFETSILEEFCYASALGTNSHCSPIVLPYSMSLVPLDQPEIAA